jgi:hypothetical protein
MAKKPTGENEGAKSLVQANQELEHSPTPADEEADEKLDEFVKSLPPPARAFMMQMTRFGGAAPHPLFHKFTPEHITKFLDYSHQDDVNLYQLEKSNRWFNLAYFVGIVICILFLVVYLAPSQKDLLVDILKTLAVFAGGFGVGYGTKAYRAKSG